MTHNNHAGTSLQARLLDQFERHPTRRALGFYSSEGELTWHTYEEFQRTAGRYAAWLSSEGLGKGDLCILVMPSSETAARLLTAVLLVGAVPLLVAPPVLQAKAAHSSLLKTLKRMIVETQPRLLLCAESMADMQAELSSVREQTRCLIGAPDAITLSADKVPYAIPAADDLAAMQLTSGTTGFPKVCVWRQANVLAALDGMVAAMELGPEDICFNWTPLYHDMGLVNNFLLCLTSGIPVVMLRPEAFVKKPSLWLRGLADSGSTVTWSPNFGFAIAAQRVSEAEMEGVRLDGVRAFWNAAERIHPETMRAFHQRFEPYGVTRQALKTNFGCAENVGGATFSDPNGAYLVELVERDPLQDERVARVVADSAEAPPSVEIVGVGRPYPGMKIQILSDSGDPLPDGHVGEVALQTPSRMEGYLNDPAATERAISNGLLRTGDLGYLRGDELFWVGRVQERITVLGKKLDPSDFEPILLEVPGLREGCFAAFGIDDSQLGSQRIVVVSEVRETAARTPQELTADVRNRVMTQMGVSVSEVLLVRAGTLTKTSSGKRRHRHFRELYAAGRLAEFEWQPEAEAG